MVLQFHPHKSRRRGREGTKQALPSDQDPRRDPRHRPGAAPRRPQLPWLIRKAVESSEITTGKLVLSHDDMFDHVFRYWTLEMCNHVVEGGRYLVTLFDFTDEKKPRGTRASTPSWRRD
ncbi:Hflx-type G domain-containing protein [Psidium guajava]|nr:Hflx-type G domain-containing protein [Psidium guajava]